MASLLLTTLNATYHHCALGLRYLHANLEELRSEAKILELTINQEPRDIAEAILAESPKLVGFGVYVWNTRETLDVVAILKRVRPELAIVLGGPEVSHETAGQPLCALADVTICGEGDEVFRELARAFLATGKLPDERVIAAPLPDITRIASPYPLYTDEDIRHRVLYVEASRGCPYRCEFCLSSLDEKVRAFDAGTLLADLDALIARGARRFKFVDRTFNLSIPAATRILRFFLDRVSLGLFLHFEMIPDRLPEPLRELIRAFPPGALQFEIGVQTFSPEVGRLVSRRQDYDKLRDNFRFLTRETGAHIHADLIAGLPGETPETFARGFDALRALGPHEIQIGILKRLKGTPITRHDAAWEMRYDAAPPFRVLSTKTMDFSYLQLVERLAKYWDLYANSGNFPATMALLESLALSRPEPSLFAELVDLTRFLDERHPQRHGIALASLAESAWRYLTERRGVEAERARAALIADYADGTVKRDVPAFLRRPGEKPRGGTVQGRPTGAVLPARQRRHQHAGPPA